MSLTKKKTLIAIFICSALTFMSIYGPSGLSRATTTINAPSSTPVSWNPKVGCTPLVLTVEQVIGNQSSSLGGATQTGSTFNPGITSPYGPDNAKRWLTQSTSTPPGWVTPGPSCTITNAQGQIVSAFVQINGVQRTYRNEEDWNHTFQPINGGTAYANGNQSDTTFNIFAPGYGVCTPTNTTSCMHSLHVEIDHDWKGAGYCGLYTACDNNTLVAETTAFKTLIDVQGFVFWDPEQVNSADHNYSGWELHPVTAWRITKDSSDYHLNANPTSLRMLAGQSVNSAITVNTYNLFTGNVTFSTSVTATSATTGAVPTATMTPGFVVISPGGIGQSQLTVAAGASSLGNFTLTVNGNNGTVTRSVSVGLTIVDFGIGASPTSLSIAVGSSGTSTVSLTSLNGFTGNVTLNASVTPASLTGSISPAPPTTSLTSSALNLQPNGTNSATLTVSTSLLTTPGTYTVTITATSNGVSRTTVVTVTVTVAGLP